MRSKLKIKYRCTSVFIFLITTISFAESDFIIKSISPLNKMLKQSAYPKYYENYEKDLKNGMSPIFAAMKNHLYPKLSEILDDEINIEMKNKFGNTPLQFAFYQNDDRLMQILLEKDANPNIGKGYYSLLSRACVENRISTVKLLLEYEADVNFIVNKSESALTVAVKGCKNFELARLLLDNGANANLKDFGNFNIIETLHIHCQNNENGRNEMLDLIYEYDSDKVNRLTH